MRADEQDALRRRCAIVVSGHGDDAPGAELAGIAEWCSQNGWQADRYGEGALIGAFEARVAALLAKPAAVFMPSGTMAQQVALRIACDRARNAVIAMHPTSHLELHEEHAYVRLHSLRAILLGERERPTSARDLDELAETPAALLVELPAREIGGRLPDWPELVALTALAGERGMWRHMDGARLWEAREYYAPASYADICAQFDSVYVSFYKGIGALAGAMLLGPEDFIAEARVWRRRHGRHAGPAAPVRRVGCDALRRATRQDGGVSRAGGRLCRIACRHRRPVGRAGATAVQSVSSAFPGAGGSADRGARSYRR